AATATALPSAAPTVAQPSPVRDTPSTTPTGVSSTPPTVSPNTTTVPQTATRVSVPTATTAPPTPPTGVIVVSESHATASVSDPTPRDQTTVTAIGKLPDRGGHGVSGATMHATWHYETTTATCDGGPTDASGTASCSRDIGTATPGYRVVIDVVFT